MSEKMKRKEFIKVLAEKMQVDESTAEKWLDAVVDVFYKAFKSKRGVTIENFGSFYLQNKGISSAFKFNPSQRLRFLLGWSSTYNPK